MHANQWATFFNNKKKQCLLHYGTCHFPWENLPEQSLPREESGLQLRTRSSGQFYVPLEPSAKVERF